MYRRVISNGDLVQLEPTWFGFGKWRLHRNLSEEVRLLEEHVERAKAKYLDLAYKSVLASGNVAEELETLQILLLENSEAYYEVGVDSSILEKREGIKYQFNKGSNNNDKKGSSSSNKDSNNKGGGNQGSNNNGGNQGNKGGKGIPISKLLGASLVLH